MVVFMTHAKSGHKQFFTSLTKERGILEAMRVSSQFDYGQKEKERPESSSGIRENARVEMD